ncbi:MAG: 16S rRNA (cytidine(1402)-2'-O)-methyltransferase, partial [Proteobacteria bacterium]|nr:16S rRNA (cytidine(1402)-2'-O)-methyltransferase [Pseudomonadota bacterium]
MINIQKAPYAEGTIYLVGVPIGNAEDISYRAVKILQKADVIFAEDTRKALRLLDNLQIKPKKVYAHFEHNQEKSVAGIIKLAQDGYTIAFISDAGMPGISDPGYLLAKEAIKQN